ncbi:MAG: CDP-alcohol phosphatidyltransferase family protein [bacterium]
MPSIYELKPLFQNILKPFMRLLYKLKVTPNQVTIISVVLSCLVGMLVFFYVEAVWIFYLVPVFLFIRMGMNALDGMLAKEYHMRTNIGVFLNELGDIVSDIFLYSPLITLVGTFNWLIIGTVLLSVISEATGMVAVQIGAKRRFDGPMGKSDRAFWFGLIYLLLGLGIKSGMWINYVVIVIMIFLLVTINNRIKNALKEVCK